MKKNIKKVRLWLDSLSKTTSLAAFTMFAILYLKHKQLRDTFCCDVCLRKLQSAIIMCQFPYLKLVSFFLLPVGHTVRPIGL
jgi:hypothetical protein